MEYPLNGSPIETVRVDRYLGYAVLLYWGEEFSVLGKVLFVYPLYRHLGYSSGLSSVKNDLEGLTVTFLFFTLKEVPHILHDSLGLGINPFASLCVSPDSVPLLFLRLFSICRL